MILPPTAAPYVWGDCTSLYARGPIAGAAGYSIAINRVVLNPGARGTPHKHYTAEYLTFISGDGMLSVEGAAPIPVHPQSTATIPPGTMHHVENVNDSTPLVYLAIHVGSQRNAILDEKYTPHGCPPTTIK